MRDLELWVLPNSGFETVPLLREHLARQPSGAGIRIRVRTERTMWDKLIGLIKDARKAQVPDLVQIPAHWTSTLAHLGVLRDLSDLDRDLDLREFEPVVRENCRLAGTARVFSLPWWMTVGMLFYRSDALKRAKIDPGSLAAWDGFREACRVLSKDWKASAGRFPVANPNPRESVSLTDIAPSVWSRGGDFFSPDGSRCVFQRSDAFGGIGDYFSLLGEGWMPLIGQNGLAPGNLFSGACAMQFSGRFPRPGAGRGPARELFDKITAAPMPDAGRGSVSAVFSQNLAVVREGADPRAAYRLLRELTRPEASFDYARAVGGFPAQAGGPEKSLREAPRFSEVFARALAGARTLPNLKMLGTVEKVFDRGMGRLVREVMLNTFASRVLRQELIHSAAEIDYVLSLDES